MDTSRRKNVKFKRAQTFNIKFNEFLRKNSIKFNKIYREKIHSPVTINHM